MKKATEFKCPGCQGKSPRGYRILHRQNILKLIKNYESEFPNEQQTLLRLSRFVSSNSRCFERKLLSGHITGSAWIMDRELEKTLLTHHKKLNRWIQPGGHADGNPKVAEVAMREAKEESGLGNLILLSDEIFDVDVHLIPAVQKEPAHYHFDCRFLIRCEGDESYTVSNESHDLAWVPLSDIRRYTEEESVLRMVAKLNSAKRPML